MKVGFWSYYEDFCYNNSIFTIPSLGLNENSVKKYNDLYRIAQSRGVNFRTLDLIDDFSKVDGYLFYDFPRMKNKLVRKAFAADKPWFLVLEECEVIRPDNWKLENHQLFEKIFTWHDDFIDNKKYHKINVYFIDTKQINKDLSKKDKLCTLVASNKSSSHPLELYSKRKDAIRWFEKNHPEDFDLYGYDWNMYPFPMDRKWVGRLNSKKLTFLRRFLKQYYPSWKGSIPLGEKSAVLEKSWFYICYENARDIPGYILEKIFDCFYCGTVPIYWGANNVTDYIPAECFIDKRKFENYEDLYAFIKGMSKTTYLEYLDNIESFLNSEKAYQFSSEYFADILIREILKTVRPET